MTAFLKKAGLGVALAATVLAAAAPADAQRYRGNRDFDRRGNGGQALAAGIAGLAIGAAIASNNNRYYDRGYGYRGNYGPRYNGYYGPRNRGFYGPRRGFYGQGYGQGYGGYGAYGGYGGGYGNYGPRCFVQRQWDPYYGGPVRVRVCR